MRNSDRLRLRPAFLSARRRAKLYFDTGSDAKFDQARLIFTRLGLPVLRSGSGSASDVEDYRGGAEQLIAEKLRHVGLRRSTVYFVEDTYVRIEALSEPTEARPDSAEWAEATKPGLETKEWFETTSFEDLDSYIVSSGGDRRASVYSTVALHVPGVDVPQVFTGHVTGSVAMHPGEGLEANEPFSWLNPNSFNAWFVPEGEVVPLSDLELEQSLDVDFRVSALLALADRIEEYIAILNLPSVSVERIPRLASGVQQPQLLSVYGPPIAVIGSTCAGKTTLGQYLSKHRYTHIEASKVLRTVLDTDLAPNSRFGFEQAMAALASHGWDIVARRALEYYRQFADSGFCITGLRTVEELNYLAHMFRDLVVVLLVAPEETRYQRYLKRRRVGDEMSLTRFRERESEHARFGLLSVADHCATIRMSNDSTLVNLQNLVEQLAESGPDISSTYVTRRGVGVEAALKSRIYRCARVLAKENRVLSPTAIELGQDEYEGLSVVKRNAVRKALAEHSELVRRLGEADGTTTYELTEHGHSYVSLIDALQFRPSLF